MNTWMKVVPSMFLAAMFTWLSFADKCLLDCSSAAVPGQNMARIFSLGIMIFLVAAILVCKIIRESRNLAENSHSGGAALEEERQDIYKFIGIGHNFMEWTHLHRSVAHRR